MDALRVSTFAARASSLVAASSICAAETWARSWRRATGVAWARAARPRRRRVGSFMVEGWGFSLGGFSGGVVGEVACLVVLVALVVSPGRRRGIYTRSRWHHQPWGCLEPG